jgi:hypothetical protein
MRVDRLLVPFAGLSFVAMAVAWRRLRGPAASAMPAAGDRRDPAGEKEMHP